MKLSIVITNYNKEKYIRYSINSILRQLSQSIEFIIIDDHSTDNSIEVIKELTANTYTKTVYLEHNVGRGKIRNIALDIIQGQYFVFIDSDDMVTEDYVNTIMTYINSNKEVYSFNLVEFPLGDIGFHSYEDTSVCNKVFKTDFIRKNNLRFDEVRYGEDVLFISKLFCLDYSKEYIDKIIYMYNCFQDRHDGEVDL